MSGPNELDAFSKPPRPSSLRGPKCSTKSSTTFPNSHYFKVATRTRMRAPHLPFILRLSHVYRVTALAKALLRRPKRVLIHRLRSHRRALSAAGTQHLDREGVHRLPRVRGRHGHDVVVAVQREDVGERSSRSSSTCDRTTGRCIASAAPCARAWTVSRYSEEGPYQCDGCGSWTSGTALRRMRAESAAQWAGRVDAVVQEAREGAQRPDGHRVLPEHDAGG